MTTTINADTVVGGAIVTGDASGELALQAAGVTKLTVTSSGVSLSGGSGTLVDTNSSQTLTNKDLSSTTNTFPPTIVYTGTASSASWSGSGPYTQAVTVSGLTSSTDVIVDVDMSAVTFANVPTVSAAYALVYRAVTSTNTLTFYATAVPATSFNFTATVI